MHMSLTNLDRNDTVSPGLEEVLGIVSNDTGLVRLGHIGEDGVDHADQHTVLERMSGILYDGHNVWALLGHINKVAT